MAITSDAIIERCRNVLHDPLPGVYWTNSELVDWINDAQRAIANIDPAVTAKSVYEFKLEQGSRQSITGTSGANGANTTLTNANPPERFPGAARVLDVYSNISISGRSGDNAVPKIAIHRRERQVLDVNIPNWQGITRRNQAPFSYWMYDDRDPTSFYLYPAAQGPATKGTLSSYEAVHLLISQAPTDVNWRITDAPGVYNEVNGSAITEKQTILDIPDVYEPAVADYVLSKAFSKQAPYNSRGQSLSSIHDQRFRLAVQNKTVEDYRTEAESDPNLTNPGGGQLRGTPDG